MLDTPVLATPVTRLLCIVILVVMLAALVYAGYIGVINFARIHV
jgi:hypothetical protein